jgi:hypothetical protein
VASCAHVGSGAATAAIGAADPSRAAIVAKRVRFCMFTSLSIRQDALYRPAFSSGFVSQDSKEYFFQAGMKISNDKKSRNRSINSIDHFLNGK